MRERPSRSMGEYGGNPEKIVNVEQAAIIAGAEKGPMALE